jgi:hypothetical protein
VVLVIATTACEVLFHTALSEVFFCLPALTFRKGQATNEMLFGGASLGDAQQESMVLMKETADKGIEVDLSEPAKK